jgi:cytochrome c biogenesis protein CcmG/thiol:disulfide interchange protein DsbE
MARTSLLRRLLTALSLVLIAGLAALLAYRLLTTDSGTNLVSSIRAGARPAAPQFELSVLWPHAETWPTTLRGRVDRGSVSLGDLRGYPTVINFWASWCRPCAAEASLLARAARARRGRIVFVGIDVHDLSSDARDFLRRHQLDYVSLGAAGESVYNAYGLIGLPETYYLDRSGRIVALTVGQVSDRKLQAGLRRIS